MTVCLKFSVTLHEHPTEDRSVEEIEADLLGTLNVPGWSIRRHTCMPWKSLVKEDIPLARSLQLDCEVEATNKARTDPNKDGHLLHCRAWASNPGAFKNFPDSHRPWLTVSDEMMLYAKKRAHHETIAVESVSFGTLVGPSLFHIHYDEKNNVRQDDNLLNSNWFHNFKYARIDIETRGVIVELQYSSICRIILSNEGTRTSLFLQLSCPPMSYRKIYEQNDSPHQKHNKRPFSKRERIVTCFDDAKTGNNTSSTSLSKREVYGKSNVLKLVFEDHKVIYQIVSRLHIRCNKIPIQWVAMSETIKKIDVNQLVKFKSSLVSSLSFDCAYLLNGILERNFVLWLQQCHSVNKSSEQVSIELRQAMLEMEEDGADCFEMALTRALDLIDKDFLIDYLHSLKLLHKYFMDDEQRLSEYRLPNLKNVESIRRCIITPTRLLYCPKQLMFTNRFLRTFNSDYAMKVSFRDEDRLKLRGSCLSDEEVYKCCVKTPMLNGLIVQQRHYYLLAWSNSQLREHSVWMYFLGIEHKSAHSIRATLGDFSKITSVPKYMARLGQCFTSTEATERVPQDSVTVIEDITGGEHQKSKKPYCFSDGVGMISLPLMKQVCRDLDLKVIPSAIQIRYDGFKGMLAINTNLTGSKIIFRKSMLKFECPDGLRALEIVKYSKPGTVFLNKQMVSILDQLGVPSSVFIKLQAKMLKRFTNVLLLDAEASEILSTRCSLPGLQYTQLASSGIQLNNEPFFRRLLLQLHKSCIGELRSKCRLEIDPSLGRTMFGILDETAILNYGEVFVSYTEHFADADNPNRTPAIRTGLVMVTKNPCIQPGDIRIFNAIDVPQLRNLVDVIVFPQKGPRPHPNEMAGSDLDGDEYSVIWDHSLMFTCGNQDASIFPVPQETETSRITEKDIINFMVRYIKNDQIGRIANAHLAMSDKYGLFSDVCKDIAYKHSLAVDFAKFGELKYLDDKERPREWPDFMEQSEMRITYESSRVLGTLFRICQNFEAVIEETGCFYEIVMIDQDLVYPGWGKYKASANETMLRYNSKLSSICTTLGIKSEIEVFIGIFTKAHGYSIDKHEAFDLIELLTHCISSLWKSFQEDFEREFLACDEDGSELLVEFDSMHISCENKEELKLQKASAWYVAAYSQLEPLYLSFAWIVSKYLAEIKSLSLRDMSRKMENPLLSRLDDELKKLGAKFPTLDKNSILQLDFFENYVYASQSVELALKALIQWAEYESIFDHPNKELSIDKSRFVRMFLDEAKSNRGSTPVEMMISFLKSCASSDSDNLEILNLKDISMRTYHTLSINQSLSALGLTEESVISLQEYELEPVKISNRFIIRGRVLGFKKEYEKLKKFSRVSEVNFQEDPQREEAFVTASGSMRSINMLKNLLKRPSQLEKVLAM